MNKLVMIMGMMLLLSACGQTTETKALPQPKSITADARGYYCTMNLSEHDGPKAQIFLESKPNEPIWFSTVNQAFGFIRHPGEPKDIAAIYVTDMGKVSDWNKPNANDAWIDAKQAYYVIESRFVGGMGTVDALPFADVNQAQAYAQKNGGKVIKFDEMPEEYIYK